MSAVSSHSIRFSSTQQLINYYQWLTQLMKHLIVTLHLTFVLYTRTFQKHSIEFDMMALSVSWNDMMSSNLSSLCQSFLKGKKQRTVLNGQRSSWGIFWRGYPQGFMLGPLLFLIYINDLTAHLECDVKLFADDTSLFTVDQDPNAASENFNHDFSLVSQWAHKWRMSFNPDPHKRAVESRFSKKDLQWITLLYSLITYR